MHTVSVLLLDGVVAFDAAVPMQVFGHYAERDLYRLRVCGVMPGPVETNTGLVIEAPHGLAMLSRSDTVIVPGIEHTDRPTPDAVLAALRRASSRGIRIVSICTGAFVLAAAGLLDGRRATTHWQDAPQLARRHPEIRLEPNALYVDEGGVLTSAGVAAGIDLCLHLVRRDYGAKHAAKIARRMVVAPHRDGGQAQFIESPVPTRMAGGLAETREWMVTRLSEPLTVADMARHATMSERSFARHFRAETGSSPHGWLGEQRVLHARHLMEETDLDVDEIARRSGFGTATTLREHFRRRLGTTPTAYRRAFSLHGERTASASLRSLPGRRVA